MPTYIVPKSPYPPIPIPNYIYTPPIDDLRSQEKDIILLNFDEGDTLNIESGKRLWITGLYVSYYTDWLASTKGQVKLSIRQTGSWLNSGWTNKILMELPVCFAATGEPDKSDQIYISFPFPIPVDLGTRSIDFYSATAAANFFFAGLLVGYFLEE